MHTFDVAANFWGGPRASSAARSRWRRLAYGVKYQGLKGAADGVHGRRRVNQGAVHEATISRRCGISPSSS